MPDGRQESRLARGYDHLIGRWSRLVARQFLAWLDPAPGLAWLDVGCGTGALSAVIAEDARPGRLWGIDPEPEYVQEVYRAIRRRDSDFMLGRADDLPFPDRMLDYTVSGLVLNLLPDPARALAEMSRVTRKDGTIAAYVWDFADGMQMLRSFWDAAIAQDPAAAEFDQGRRYPLCRPEPLRALFEAAGLSSVHVHPLEAPIRFSDFADYWRPIEAGHGRPSEYLQSLDAGARERLRTSLERQLPVEPDGSIVLGARAWGVAGRRP